MDNRPPRPGEPDGTPRRPSATPRPSAGQPRRPQVPPRASDPPRRQPGKADPPRREPPKRDPQKREPRKGEPQKREPQGRDPRGRESLKRDTQNRAEPPRREPPRRVPPKREAASRAEPARGGARDTPARPRPLADRPTVRTTPAAEVKPKPPAPRPRPRPAAARRPSAAQRGASTGGKIFVSLLSALVLVITGVAWQNLNALTDGLTKQDLSLADEGERPADGAIDIMLVGMDSRTDSKGNPLPQEILNELQAGGTDDGGFNTDTLILVHIPNDSGKAYAVSFPRDSYVKIAGGFGRHKINSAYGYAKGEAAEKLKNSGKSAQDVEMESRKAGANNLIQTVQDLTGTTIDHYAEVNLVGFYDITKAIGGIDVCLNTAVKDKFSGANFAAGPQTIEGKDALAFVRQRHGLPLGDLDRVVRQQVFMAGLAKKMLSAGVLADNTKRNDMIKAVSGAIVLDDGWDITKFALQMKDMTGGNMTFQTIPTGNPDLQTPEDGSAVEVDESEVRRFFKNLGKTPATSTPPDPTFDNSTVTVDVRNASGAPGLAAGVLQSLVGKKFKAGQPGNAESMRKSVVRYGLGGEAGANAVQNALGGMEIEEDPDIPKGTVRVFLGADYSGPGAQGFTASKPLNLDGARQQPAADPDAPKPITADGVRCVN
ncbi:transcriptional attenuator, LytR family [Lentzea fradiae]|uniref:Transcriptional attenuator, LytR family n=1 Tax=Lentzea fradiae TaxID=200378 RepID=A0A1G7SHX6_9PSEU|nr:LCP family protein [Lentzea fradiae]SDG22655.1 transcriptional attenuator, LytR family [Lentzea fradiae]